MDFEVGSLADLISGTVTSKKHSKKAKPSTKIQYQKVEEKVVKKRKSDVVSGSSKKRMKMSHLDNADGYPEDHMDQVVNRSTEKRKRPKIKNYSPKKEQPEKVNSFSSEAEVAEQESRTVFVGNLVNTTTKYNLKNLFGKFGEVDAVRLRGAPVADPRTSKRVAIIKREFHPERTTFIAYVRFKEAEAAHKALAANGMVYKDHTIRVDMAFGADHTNEKKAVFVGNVKFTVEEEDLRSMFDSCGKIESVRLVRDKKTGLGKGIAYINFESTSAVELALELDGVELEKRPLRVARCGSAKKKPRTKKPKKAMKVNGAGKSNKIESGLPSPKGKRNNDGTKVKKETQAAISAEFQGQEVVDQKKQKMLKKKKKNKSELQKKIMLNNLHLNPKSRPKKMKPSQ